MTVNDTDYTIGKDFFLRELDNGNRITISGSREGLLMGTIYMTNEKPSYKYMPGSTMSFGVSLCEATWEDDKDHNKEIDLIRDTQRKNVEFVKTSTSVGDIKKLAKELGFKLDPRKKQLTTVKEDFLTKYVVFCGDGWLLYGDDMEVPMVFTEEGVPPVEGEEVPMEDTPVEDTPVETDTVIEEETDNE